jgi:hypothetical protein
MVVPSPSKNVRRFLDQELFTTMLRMERRRTERSRGRFILMLLEFCDLARSDDENGFGRILLPLWDSTRETDIKGWYREKSVLGVIFTEIGGADGKSAANALRTKLTSALSTTLSGPQIDSVKISFHIFPEPSTEHGPGPADSALYPDREESIDARRLSRRVKRGMDIAAASSS